MNQWTPEEQAIAAKFLNPFRGQMNIMLLELHDLEATPQHKFESLQSLFAEFVAIHKTELTEKKRKQLNVAMDTVLILLDEIMRFTE